MKKLRIVAALVLAIIVAVGVTNVGATSWRWTEDISQPTWTPTGITNIVGDGLWGGADAVNGNSAEWKFVAHYQKLIPAGEYVCAEGYNPVPDDPTQCQKWIVSGYEDEVCTEDTCPVVQFSHSHQIVDVAGHYVYADKVKVVDVLGHYTCPSGYTLDGTVCHKEHHSDKQATWVDTTYKYVCPDGYSEHSGQCRLWVPDTYKTETFGPIDVQYYMHDDECKRPNGESLHVPSWAMSEFNKLPHEKDCVHHCETIWVDTSHYVYQPAEWVDTSYYVYMDVTYEGALDWVTRIPHMMLFLSEEGFGQLGPNSSGVMETVHYCILLSSQSGPISVDIVKARCLVGGQTELPADFVNPTCEGPVKSHVDLGPGQYTKGSWKCDSLLLNIPAGGINPPVNGARLPLFNVDGQNSLWRVYDHSWWIH